MFDPRSRVWVDRCRSISNFSLECLTSDISDKKTTRSVKKCHQPDILAPPATKNRQAVTHSNKNGKLSPKQIQALDLMMAGASSEEIARQVGKSTRTVERWKKLDSFRHVMSEVSQKVQDNLIDEYATRMTRLGIKAMSVVEEVLDDDEESTRNRLQAASLAGKWADLDTTEPKVMGQLLQLLQDLKKDISQGAYDEIEMAIAIRGGFKKENIPAAKET